MRGYCKIIIIGNMTRDVDLRYTQSGAAIGKFGMAINRQWKDADGNMKEEVTFIDVDCFGKSAETIGQYCKKGSALLIEGRLKQDTWTDKQTNEKRSRLLVVAESFQFLGGKPEQSETQEPLPPRQKPKAKPAPEQVEDDSVPF